MKTNIKYANIEVTERCIPVTVRFEIEPAEIETNSPELIREFEIIEILDGFDNFFTTSQLYDMISKEEHEEIIRRLYRIPNFDFEFMF